MPSDDVLWAAIILTGLWAVICYFVLAWTRSTRQQIKQLADSTAQLEFRYSSVRTDVGELVRELSDKIGNAELDSMAAGAQASLQRREYNKVVSRRG